MELKEFTNETSDSKGIIYGFTWWYKANILTTENLRSPVNKAISCFN